MRFPWSKTEPEVYEEKSKRLRETLAQTAEKIIQRKMKKDPDGYGLEAAERIKNITQQEPKTVGDFLRELKEYRAAMKDAGLEGGEGKGWLPQLLEALPSVPAILEQLKQQEGVRTVRTFVVRDEAGVLRELSEAEYQRLLAEPKAEPTKPVEKKAKPKKEPEQPQVSLSDLVSVLDMEPTEAHAVLKEQSPAWIALLQTQTPERIVEATRNFASDPQSGAEIQDILTRLDSEEGKKWLSNLIELARADVNGSDNT